MRLEDFLEAFPVRSCEGNYGPNMLESSLADWLELAALRHVNAPWSTIADAWIDSGLPQYGIGRMIDEGRTSADELAFYDLAREDIRWRGEYLDELYPFEVNRYGTLAVKSTFNLADSVYVDLLLVSLLKGFACEQDRSILKVITIYFELLTNECLRAGFGGDGLLFKSAVMGTAGVSGTLEDRLSYVAEELGLTADPTAAPRSSSAKDDGVDIIGGIVWGDQSKTDLLWTVQAACGQSREWRTKLDRIHASKWASYFGEFVTPRSLIAVPYQLTDSAVKYTIDTLGDKSFLDRARLCRIAGNRLDLQTENLASSRSSVLDFASAKLGVAIWQSNNFNASHI